MRQQIELRVRLNFLESRKAFQSHVTSSSQRVPWLLPMMRSANTNWATFLKWRNHDGNYHGAPLRVHGPHPFMNLLPSSPSGIPEMRSDLQPFRRGRRRTSQDSSGGCAQKWLRSTPRVNSCLLTRQMLIATLTRDQLLFRMTGHSAPRVSTTESANTSTPKVIAARGCSLSSIETSKRLSNVL